MVIDVVGIGWFCQCFVGLWFGWIGGDVDCLVFVLGVGWWVIDFFWLGYGLLECFGVGMGWFDCMGDVGGVDCFCCGVCFWWLVGGQFVLVWDFFCQCGVGVVGVGFGDVLVVQV